MPLQNSTVLVTGASGFIGSHLVQTLVHAGARVRAMIHYKSDPRLHNLDFLLPEEIAATQIIRGDVRDPFFVNSAVAGCDIVYHLAALIGIPYSYLAPASYVETNVLGTLNVLEACRSLSISRLVHTSTSECYGTAQYTPIDEQHPLQGQSPYSASKIAAEKMVEAYFRSFALPVVIVRPFNTFGPRQSARAVIPTIVTQIDSGAKTLRLGSLNPIRDFTFVTDTAQGILHAGEVGGIEGEVFNLGVGKGISIGDVARTIMTIMDNVVELEIDQERVRPQASEVERLISNNSKARQGLGWNPEISLVDGLEAVVRFVRANRHLYRPESYGV